MIFIKCPNICATILMRLSLLIKRDENIKNFSFLNIIL